MNWKSKKLLALPVTLAAVTLLSSTAMAACCYFAALDKDVKQPGQRAFVTWDEREKTESFTVQPQFEGNASDFGMVIPTPSKPKLQEMPRDFFKAMAVFTILEPMDLSKYKPRPLKYKSGRKDDAVKKSSAPQPSVRVLERGVVGNLDYKILEADKASALYEWLKVNKYSYAGDQATLDYYVQKHWNFTVMKIDPRQMKSFLQRHASLSIAVLALLAAAGGAAAYLASRGSGSNSDASTSVGQPRIGGAFELLDRNGHAFTEKDLLGRPFALYFGYTRCPDFCPMTLHKIKSAVEGDTALQQKLSLLFISVDVQNEKAADLKSYLQVFPYARGFTGSRDDIAAVEKAFGAYSKEDQGKLSHSLYLYLLNREGKVIYLLRHDDPVKKIRQALKQATE